MSAVLPGEWDHFNDLTEEPAQSSTAKISPETAFQVTTSAMSVLQERIDSVHAALVEHERARRRKFNASWLGRVLPFLQKNPDEAIHPDALLRSSLRRWVNEIAELSMDKYYLARAQAILLQAQNTPNSFEVDSFDWMGLQALAGVSA